MPAPKKAIFTGFSLLSAVLSVLSLKLGRRREIVNMPKVGDLVKGVKDVPEAWAWAFSYAAIQGAVFTFYPLLVEIQNFPRWYASLLFFLLVGARTLTFSLREKLPQFLKSPYAGATLLSPGILLPLAYDATSTAILAALIGVGAGILYGESLSKAFSSSLEKRSAYTGLFESFIGFGYTAGPLIAGLASTLYLDAAIPAAALASIAVACTPWRKISFQKFRKAIRE